MKDTEQQNLITNKMPRTIEHTKPERFFNTISLLESEHEEILIKLTELQNLVQDICEIDVDYRKYAEIKDKVSDIYSRIHMNFKMEEDYLFPELNEVLPEQSSISAMHAEHTEIIELCNIIGGLLESKERLDNNKEKLEAEIVTLIDLVERMFHKKENIMYYEAEVMLNNEVLEEIYEKMLNDFNKSS
jgi:hemerythrin-like domain-containing protein